MKILNREDFLELPDGVVFAKYSESDGMCCDSYEGLCIKVKTYRYDNDCPSGLYKKGDPFDFVTMQLSNFKTYSRDGLFEEDQLFAVFEQDDIDSVIERLQQSKYIL